MDYQVGLIEAEPQPIAIVRGEVPLAGISEFLGGAFGEVMAAAADQHIAITGPPVALYLPQAETFGIEAGFPTDRPLDPTGRVTVSALPGGTIAQILHRGAYSDVAGAYQALKAWEQESGYLLAGPPWESYLDGPEVAAPRTIVCAPVRPKESA